MRPWRPRFFFLVPIDPARTIYGLLAVLAFVVLSVFVVGMMILMWVTSFVMSYPLIILGLFIALCLLGVRMLRRLHITPAQLLQEAQAFLRDAYRSL